MIITVLNNERNNWINKIPQNYMKNRNNGQYLIAITKYYQDN